MGMLPIKHLSRALTVAAAALVIAGCGSSSSNNNSGTTLTGVFQDAPVDGLRYMSASQEGITSGGGTFRYRHGETVAFYLGDLMLGEAPGSGIVTPVDIVPGAEGAINTEVENILRLLQTLDDNNNTEDGITIPEAVRGLAFTGIDLSDAAGAQNALTHINSEAGLALTLISAEAAQEHFRLQYTDHNGETRTALYSAGAAEYHAGTGYGETLFDSAEKKCQNCHNQLYDTWKNSMHGKSWTDPIFQSKFQDFLKTHLAKIGSNPTGDLEYTEAKFKGVAQTCIKCHAPGAYYAGDVQVTLTALTTDPTTADLTDAKNNHQNNSMELNGTFNPDLPINVVSASAFNSTLYKATFDIGHEANKEGINCAFCHSMETVRMMRADGVDGGQYTLKDALRVGPVGPIKADAGELFYYHTDPTESDMNRFFRLWGPEKYVDPSNTPKTADFDVNKSKDGRYTMHSVALHDENNTHYTGGPFYGPFGVTGVSNENADDESNRSALVSGGFDTHSANHFGNHGKALCLSCHQRSSGAAVPSGEDGAGSFMELCSTWNAVTTGSDNNYEDTASSPKCQKCHMERIEGTVLHRWADPDTLWTTESNPALTAHFDPDDPENLGDENPVATGWFNSHAFLGASKTGQKTSVTAKIQSGFEATLGSSVTGDTLTVTTTLKNLTAHMFPGAHPMRRVLTRVIVTDDQNGTVEYLSAAGISTFGDITNTLATVSGQTLHASQPTTVSVVDGGSDALDFPGKSPDLNGSALSSQKFDGTVVTVAAPDGTVKSQEINTTTGAIEGSVTNAAIVDSSDAGNFTRIYGHETGKKYDGTFVVRPGFDSNMVAGDTRLSPNETEHYTLTYDIAGKTGVTVTYKVYYMQKGAGGAFPVTAEGWLDEALNTSKKLLITEVYSSSESVN